MYWIKVDIGTTVMSEYEYRKYAGFDETGSKRFHRKRHTLINSMNNL